MAFRHDSRVPSAHEREALALCDWSGGFWDRSCVPGTALPLTKKHRACTLGTWLSCPVPTLQKPGRQHAAG
ncbi:unnamed protein product [Staurois parvus]|uniref:Uncharacterized protein n=1 Tax=Staurois parvus TaxID=386267 RepID=A0ABN9H2L7_9NEOB|nr:unnamed protein product [Staurois parvus]